MSTILQYTQILIKHGMNSPEALAFYANHSSDPKFVKRAEVLHKLHQAKTTF
jgi:hypothetical protein